MTSNVALDKTWSRFVLCLKAHHPFFAVLALFARFKLDEDVQIASTRDKCVIVAPEFIRSLPVSECHAYLLHQVLHLALNHAGRGLERNLQIWNIAADIVVNNIIHEATGWVAASRTAWDLRYQGLSVERVYALLMQEARSTSRKTSAQGQGGGSEQGSSQGQLPTSKPGKYHELMERYGCYGDLDIASSDSPARQTARDYWGGAFAKAQQLLHTCSTPGKTSASLLREIEVVVGGQVDWRTLLWKFAAPAANDYGEFDHRFLHRGLYLEALLADELRVDVIVDTSGSISKEMLQLFLQELLAIHACHPAVELRFFYIDVVLIGPLQIPASLEEFPVPIGAGGTSFKPYFRHLENEFSLTESPAAVVYFTDGFGDFPETEPGFPVLWLLTEDGAEAESIPFGTIVRVANHAE